MAFNWRSVIGTVAPTIATALGGPLAGLAVKAIGGALGLGEGASEADIEARIAGATPADLLALKKADQEFAVKMRELDVDLERIAAGDRDSARLMQRETKSWAPGILASVVVSGFIVSSIAVLGGWVEGLKDPLIAALVGSVIGNITAATMLVLNFYFGTSASSRAKDETIKSLSR
ncbi:MAG: hypothetical protein INF12_14540 [Methylobacterium sp.]|nr:hypothetical protein [Methylobacterium sp.]